MLRRGGGGTQLFFKNAADCVQIVPNTSSSILRASLKGLKGQCHEIFECWFFASNGSSWAP